MDLGLKHKTALVIGASAGIGAAAAGALAEEGARVAISARAGPRLEAMAQRLRALGGEVIALPADVTVAGDAEAVIQAAVAQLGRLDILAVSIGAAQGGLFWELEDVVWEQAVAVKLMGVVRLLRAAAPVMQSQGSGSMVVVVGNNGRQPNARLAPGGAVNAACLAVVKSLADELAPFGVRVNAVNPGPTRTGRWDTLMTNLSASSGKTIAEEEAAQLSQIPMGRICEPEEIGRLIAVLASDLVPSMTGASVTVDGGSTRGLP